MEEVVRTSNLELVGQKHNNNMDLQLGPDWGGGSLVGLNP